LKKRVLISALEPSANLHLSEVLKHLEGCEICGIFDEKFGSPFMKSSEFSAMGFVEVLPLIFKAKRAIKALTEMAKNCDAVLLIDSPAFNLPLAKALKKAQVKAKITYYILPQVWAWKPKRVKKVEKYCDNLAAIWPFEKRFYSKCQYVGNPLLDEIKTQNIMQKNGKIAFLPGSRKSEIWRLMPIFREVAQEFKEYEKILPIPAHLMAQRDEIYGDLSEFSVTNDAVDALKNAEFAFICSGTATMQAALIGTPFLLCYRAKAVDIAIARKFVKLKYIGLANIILDFMGEEPLNREFIQEEVTKENLMNAYQNIDKLKFAYTREKLLEYLKFGSAENVANLIKG